MKSLSKILLCFFISTQSLLAREVILLENLADEETGKIVMKILEEKFNVPRQLITYRKPAEGCAKKSEAVLQLCLKTNGELDIVKVDRFVMENSFSAFF